MQPFPEKKHTWVSSASQIRRWLAYRADLHGHHPHRIAVWAAYLAPFSLLYPFLFSARWGAGDACWGLPSLGISSHVRPSSRCPACFLLAPPHCLKKKGRAVMMALGLNRKHSFFCIALCVGPAFPACDDPVNLAQA